MAKWADFAVVAVKYNRERSAIAEVEVRADNGDAIAADGHSRSRQDVVTAIVRGATFVTAYRRDGKWTRGEDVRVLTINGERFLRTDDNSVRADNLGNLPEYQ